MAESGRGNDLLKVLDQKMKSSANDYHYAAKYWLRFNPNDSTKPIDAPRDNSFFGNVMTRLLLFPIWLPYWYWSRQKSKSEMREFVIAGTGERVRDDELIRQLALEWVGLHPWDFVLGEYDPKVPKLQSTFEKILGESA